MDFANTPFPPQHLRFSQKLLINSLYSCVKLRTSIQWKFFKARFSGNYWRAKLPESECIQEDK